MKVLFAIKHLASATGGAERVLCKVCSDLGARGHEISLLTFDKPGGRPFYELDARVKRIDLEIGASYQPTTFFETIKRMKALRRVVRLEKPDMVVGFLPPMFITLAFALVGTGFPALGSEHIVGEHYRSRRFQYLLLILASQLLKKVTVLSDAIRSTYPVSIRSKMAVIPNPVEKVAQHTRRGLKKASYTLLNVGRLYEQKGQATLIKAFARIANEFPDWRLKIIGDGPLRKELEELVEASGLQSSVTLPGVTSKINAEYESADIFVTSSIYEALGLVTAEAMSHGLPVVGFADCPGTNELIQNNITGILVEPKDNRVGALATALSNLMGSSELQKQLGIAGRDAIDKRFLPEEVCDRWEDLLLSLMKEKA